MIKKALENFIDYCSNLMIAEEGTFSNAVKELDNKYQADFDKISELLKKDNRITVQINGHKMMKTKMENYNREYSKISAESPKDTRIKEKNISGFKKEIESLNDTLSWLTLANSMGIKDMDDLHTNYTIHQDPKTNKYTINKKNK